MAFEAYVRSGQKMLRMGYTTGTCAALASMGAARLLFTGEMPEELSIMTAKGLLVTVEKSDKLDSWGTEVDENGRKWAWCCIIKDAGDDIDVTQGLGIYSKVALREDGEIVIDGGVGVGRVTKPGLDQPVGNAAINSSPRRVIKEMVTEICQELDHEGGMDVVIYIPNGAEIAKKTFNPMLGIEGGISVLGTSGIVEPMSIQALVDTIEVEVKQAALNSKKLVLTPGNYGRDFIDKKQVVDPVEMGIPLVKVSNFIGDALDIAATRGFEEILFIGHIGKLVKVAGSIMVTHSRYADCRREIFTAYAAIHGAGTEVCQKLMEAMTTEACIEILVEAGLKEVVIADIINAIQFHVQRRLGEETKIGIATFSSDWGYLGQSKEATEILAKWEAEYKAQK